jgi:KDO2-lipid IV(A) lauroyltransferase
MVGLLKFVARVVAFLPAGMVRAWARHWGWLLAHVARIRRGYVLETLARCLPDVTVAERRRIYVEMWQHQVLNIMELMRFYGGRRAEFAEGLEVYGEEHVQAALARGKGALILTAHLGNYVLMGILAVQRFGYSLSIISKVLKNRVAEELFESLRQAGGVNGIHAQQAYRPAVRALRRQELVGFMLDQQRPASQGVFVDFFGRLASTSPGLAFMSAATGAPVVPVFIRRKASGGHILEALPLMEPPPDREEETIRQHTAVYTKIIEEQVRRTPAQWLWLHKRWKSRPLGEGGGEGSGFRVQGSGTAGGREQRSEVGGQGELEQPHGRTRTNTDGHGRLEGAESRGQGGTGTASALSERSYRGEPMEAGEVADGGA